MDHIRLSRVLLLFAGSLWAATGTGASFDCAAAKTNIEISICATPSLSSLDDRLAVVYRVYLAGAADKTQARQQQRQWVTGVRDVCADTTCLTRAYSERIAALDGSASTARAAPGARLPQSPIVFPKDQREVVFTVVDTAKDLDVNALWIPGIKRQGDSVFALFMTNFGTPKPGKEAPGRTAQSHLTEWEANCSTKQMRVRRTTLRSGKSLDGDTVWSNLEPADWQSYPKETRGGSLTEMLCWPDPLLETILEKQAAPKLRLPGSRVTF